jgi:rhodanese-related sulfurtransferase
MKNDLGHFTLDTPMREVVERFPFSKVLLQSKFHMGGCQKCGYELQDSIQEAAEKNSKNPEEVTQALNDGREEMAQCEISPEKLKMILDAKISKTILVDVREPWEYEVCHFPNSELLTEENLQSILTRSKVVDVVVLICHHGVRSLNAAMYFRQNEVHEAYSLAGGIDLYAKKLDSSLQRY